MHSKSGKFRIVIDYGGERGGIYPALTAFHVMEGVYTEGRRGVVTSKASRKGQSGRRKEKACIRVLDLVGHTPAYPKKSDADADKGNSGGGGRGSSRENMQRVIFT